MSENEETVPVHPLLSHPLKIFNNWEQWRQYWDQNEYVEVSHGLLHIGFDVPCHDWEQSIDRVLFYLGIAESQDGDLYGISLNKPEEHGCYNLYGNGKEPKSFRQAIARKAFEVLCLRFFKKAPKASSLDDFSWIPLIFHEEVLKAVIFYFRTNPTCSRGWSFVNLTNSIFSNGGHHEKIAEDFLNDLAHITLTGKTDRYCARLCTEAKELFRSVKPDMLPILGALGKLLQVIISNPAFVDDACMKKLEEMALKAEMSDIPSSFPDRKCRTIEESASVGSSAGQAILLLRNYRNEKARIESIQRLKVQQRNAEEELRRLSAQS